MTTASDKDGRWSVRRTTDSDYRYFVTSGIFTSSRILNQPAPLLSPVSSTPVARGTLVTLRGNGPTGAVVFLHFHRAGTAATDYSIVGTAITNAAGTWSRTYTAGGDFRVFVSRSVSPTLTNERALVQTR